MTSIQSAGSKLATFAASTTLNDIPISVRHQAHRALVNHVAAALAGSHDATIDAASRVLARSRADRSCGLIGRHERFDVMNAACINAMASNVHDFCDTHNPTILHPSAPVFPPLFAIAEQQQIPGADLLRAFIVGVEVECRIANAISPTHYARGWHITSTCGVFGAAAAVGNLLGVDAVTMTSAFGSAAAQSSGLVETLGSSAKSISVGNAARNGLLSIMLAREGFEGPATPLDGERGFLRVYCDQPSLSELDGHEGTWQLMLDTFKPYPCGVVLNPVIDACLLLAATDEFMLRSTQDIVDITLTGHPLLRQRTDRPGVTTGRQSQVSGQHAVSISLLRQRAGLAEFSDEAVQDATVRALGALVRFRDDAAMTVDAATVEISYGDGKVLAHSVESARGSLERPLTDDELSQKLRDLNRSRIETEPLLDVIWNLDKAVDAAEVMRLASSAV